MKRRMRRWVALAALATVLATVATACYPSDGTNELIYEARATYWSSEEGKIPPPEWDQLRSALSVESTMSAAAGEGREYMISRGWASFSTYFTERATRWICNNGPVGLALVSAGSIIINKYVALLNVIGGPAVAKACAAKGDTNCLRIRWTWGLFPLGWYNVESHHSWCRVDWRTVT